jgi:hypothetical protein
MTDTADREEAVVRVRAYVESWEGFEPSVTISDERDPNSLYLGDLRLLLSGGEGGSVAIASREGRAVIANLATEELLALVLDGDHRRGCQGREYTCSCGYDTRVEREATTLRSALTDPRQPSEAPVAWRVKDFADGWIVFDNKARAEEEARVSGALIQPLFASLPKPPVTADEGWIKRSDAVTAIRLFPLGHNAILHDGEGGRFVSAAVAEAMIACLPAPPTGEGAHKRYPSTGPCVVCGENCDNETRAFPTGEGGGL